MRSLKYPYLKVEKNHKMAYGGNQSWFPYKFLRNCGCGVISAADVLLYLKGKETDFNFDLDNGVGEVVIGNSHLKQLGADEWIDHDASKTVDIDNGIGSITVHFSEK